MTIVSCYVAHPVSPQGTETLVGNLVRAGKWFDALTKAEPSVAFCMPWWVNLTLGCEDDADSVQRALGITKSARLASQCDGIVLVGGRFSIGMMAEAEAVRSAGGWIADLTIGGVNPPPTCFTPAGSLLEMGRNEWRRRQRSIADDVALDYAYAGEIIRGAK